MYKVVYVNSIEIKSNSFRCPTYSRQDFDEKKALDIPCTLLENHEGENSGATAIAKHRYEELLQAFDRWVSNGK